MPLADLEHMEFKDMGNERQRAKYGLKGRLLSSLPGVPTQGRVEGHGARWRATVQDLSWEAMSLSELLAPVAEIEGAAVGLEPTTCGFGSARSCTEMLELRVVIWHGSAAFCTPEHLVASLASQWFRARPLRMQIVRVVA